MRSRQNRKPISEPRDTTVNIRVSRTERQRLGELADLHGVSIGAYLIGLALGDGADLLASKPDPSQVSISGF